MDLSGGERNTTQAWVDAMNMGRLPTDPEYIRVPMPKVGTTAEITTQHPRVPGMNVQPPKAPPVMPIPKPKMNRAPSQPGFATSFLGELSGDRGDGSERGGPTSIRGSGGGSERGGLTPMRGSGGGEGPSGGDRMGVRLGRIEEDRPRCKDLGGGGAIWR